MCAEHTIPLLLSILRAHETKKLPTSPSCPGWHPLALRCNCPNSLSLSACSQLLFAPTSGLREQPVTFLSLFRKLLNASHARTC